jgi:hypothetical protein
MLTHHEINIYRYYKKYTSSKKLKSPVTYTTVCSDKNNLLFKTISGDYRWKIDPHIFFSN